MMLLIVTASLVGTGSVYQPAEAKMQLQSPSASPPGVVEAQLQQPLPAPPPGLPPIQLPGLPPIQLPAK
jgi:hypothetical protein